MVILINFSKVTENSLRAGARYIIKYEKIFVGLLVNLSKADR